MAKGKRTITVEVDHLVGEFVHLHTDPDKARRMVTRLFVGPGTILYELTAGASTSTHYAIEIGELDEEGKRPPGYKTGDE